MRKVLLPLFLMLLVFLLFCYKTGFLLYAETKDYENNQTPSKQIFDMAANISFKMENFKSPSVLLQTADTFENGISLKTDTAQDNTSSLTLCIKSSVYSPLCYPIANGLRPSEERAIQLYYDKDKRLKAFLDNVPQMDIKSLTFEPELAASGIRTDSPEKITTDIKTFETTVLGKILVGTENRRAAWGAIYLLFVLAAIAIPMAAAGKTILKSVMETSVTDKWLLLSSSFFTGLAFAVSSYLLITLASKNSILAFWITFAFLTALSAKPIVFYFRQKNKTVDYKMILSFSLLFVIIFIFHIPAFTETIPSVWGFSGSLHSGRYANIAAFIYHHNVIPTISQNFGQSILTVMIMYMGSLNPYMILNLWLNAVMAMLALLVFGFLGSYTDSLRNKIAGTILVVCAQPALSLNYMLMWDSGSPLIYNHYSDSLLSLATVLVFIIFLLNPKKKVSIIYGSLFIFALSFYWTVGSPQAIILIICGLSAVIFFYYAGILFKKSKNKKLQNFGNMIRTVKIDKKYIFVIIVIFACALLISRYNFGMFLSSDIANHSIPGVMTAPSELNLEIGTMVHILPEYTKKYPLPLTADTFAKENIYEIIWQIEAALWHSLRLTFFSWLGLLLAFFYLLKNRRDKNTAITGGKEYYSTREELMFKTLSIFAGVIFIAAYTVTFLFSSKWQLTRFLYIGVFLTFILLVISSIKLGYDKKRFTWVVFAFLLIPFIYYSIVKFLIVVTNGGYFNNILSIIYYFKG